MEEKLILIIEAIRRKPLKRKTEINIQLIGIKERRKSNSYAELVENSAK